MTPTLSPFASPEPDRPDGRTATALAAAARPAPALDDVNKARPRIRRMNSLLSEREATLREYHRLSSLAGQLAARIEEIDAAVAMGRRAERERVQRRYAFD